MTKSKNMNICVHAKKDGSRCKNKQIKTQELCSTHFKQVHGMNFSEFKKRNNNDGDEDGTSKSTDPETSSTVLPDYLNKSSKEQRKMADSLFEKLKEEKTSPRRTSPRIKAKSPKIQKVTLPPPPPSDEENDYDIERKNKDMQRREALKSAVKQTPFHRSFGTIPDSPVESFSENPFHLKKKKSFVIMDDKEQESSPSSEEHIPPPVKSPRNTESSIMETMLNSPKTKNIRHRTLKSIGESRRIKSPRRTFGQR